MLNPARFRAVASYYWRQGVEAGSNVVKNFNKTWRLQRKKTENHVLNCNGCNAKKC